MPIKQSEATATIRETTLKYVEIFNDFKSQVEQEKISLANKIKTMKANSKEKVKSLQEDMKDLAYKIIDNNKTLAKHKLETVQFDFEPRKRRAVANHSETPQ